MAKTNGTGEQFGKIWGGGPKLYGFVQVPRLLVRSRIALGLSAEDLLILVALVGYLRDDGSRVVFPSLKTLGKDLGLKSHSSLTRSLRRIEKANCIRIHPGDFSSHNVTKYDLGPLVVKLQEGAEDAERAKDAEATRREQVERLLRLCQCECDKVFEDMRQNHPYLQRSPALSLEDVQPLHLLLGDIWADADEVLMPKVVDFTWRALVLPRLKAYEFMLFFPWLKSGAIRRGSVAEWRNRLLFGEARYGDEAPGDHAVASQEHGRASHDEA